MRRWLLQPNFLKKVFGPFWILLFFPFPLFSSDFNATQYRRYLPALESFTEQVKTQSRDGNYTLFNGYYLIDHRSYQNLVDKRAFNGHTVLYDGYIDDFLKISSYRAVTLYTVDRVYLSFPIRLYENLYYYDRDDKMYALCFLPYYDDCILLGIDYENSIF